MKLFTFLGTVALAVGIGHGTAGAAIPRSACADLNNNGVCDAGDVNIEKQIANDGYFSTARSEGNYEASTEKVGIVLSGRITGKKGIVYLVASGDIVVNDAVGAGSENSAVILSSTGGAIKLANNGKVRAGLMLKMTAAGDILLGDKCTLYTRNRDYGGSLYVYSSSGSVRVGEKSNLSGDGFTTVSTNDSTGGDLTVGAAADRTDTMRAAAVTAGRAVDVRRATIGGSSVLIGSHASAGARSEAGPGQTTVTNSTITGADSVRVFAAGGEGSMVNVSGTEFEATDPAAVALEADVVVR
jgi:hypothetical protein